MDYRMLNIFSIVLIMMYYLIRKRKIKLKITNILMMLFSSILASTITGLMFGTMLNYFLNTIALIIAGISFLILNFLVSYTKRNKSVVYEEMLYEIVNGISISMLIYASYIFISVKTDYNVITQILLLISFFVVLILIKLVFTNRSRKFDISVVILLFVITCAYQLFTFDFNNNFYDLHMIVENNSFIEYGRIEKLPIDLYRYDGINITRNNPYFYYTDIGVIYYHDNDHEVTFKGYNAEQITLTSNSDENWFFYLDVHQFNDEIFILDLSGLYIFDGEENTQLFDNTSSQLGSYTLYEDSGTLYFENDNGVFEYNGTDFNISTKERVRRDEYKIVSFEGVYFLYEEVRYEKNSYIRIIESEIYQGHEFYHIVDLIDNLNSVHSYQNDSSEIEIYLRNYSSRYPEEYRSESSCVIEISDQKIYYESRIQAFQVEDDFVYINEFKYYYHNEQLNSYPFSKYSNSIIIISIFAVLPIVKSKESSVALNKKSEQKY